MRENIDQFDNLGSRNRAQILPLWIKVFSWIFVIAGIFVVLLTILELFGLNFWYAIYGFETNDLLSLKGLLISSIFMLKAIVGLALIQQVDWAVNLGKFDARLGIFLCLLKMIVLPFLLPKSFPYFSIRFELFLLVPYLLSLQKLAVLWRNSDKLPYVD